MNQPIERVSGTGAHLDRVVARIVTENFAVRQVPEARVCGECDFRAYCAGERAMPMSVTPAGSS